MRYLRNVFTRESHRFHFCHSKAQKCNKSLGGYKDLYLRDVTIKLLKQEKIGPVRIVGHRPDQ